MLALRLRVERRQRNHPVVAREHAREPGLELLATDGREEPDPTEIHADHRNAASKEALERAQHRAVAAEDDRDVGRLEIVLRLAVPVLLDLLARKEELHARLEGDLLEAFERRADRRRLAVRDDGGAVNRLS